MEEFPDEPTTISLEEDLTIGLSDDSLVLNPRFRRSLNLSPSPHSLYSPAFKQRLESAVSRLLTNTRRCSIDEATSPLETLVSVLDNQKRPREFNAKKYFALRNIFNPLAQMLLRQKDTALLMRKDVLDGLDSPALPVPERVLVLSSFVNFSSQEPLLTAQEITLTVMLYGEFGYEDSSKNFWSQSLGQYQLKGYGVDFTISSKHKLQVEFLDPNTTYDRRHSAVRAHWQELGNIINPFEGGLPGQNS